MVKRKPKSLNNLSFKPPIVAVACAQTGRVLDTEDIIDEIYDIALLNQRAVNSKIHHDYDKIINALYDNNGNLKNTQNTIISEQEGYSYADIGGKDCSSSLESLSVPSSLNRIMGASAVTIARQSRKRKEYFQQYISYLLGENEKPKISESERKTLSNSKSRQGCVLDYSLTNNNFKIMDKVSSDRKFFVYKLKVKKSFVNFVFRIPENYRDYEWYSAPKFVFNKDGSYSVIMTAQYEPLKYQISDKYVIGIDPGIKEYITYTVMERKNSNIVDSGTLPNNLREFYNSTLRTQREIASLQQKIKELEKDTNLYGLVKDKNKLRIVHLKTCVSEQRSSLSRKRKDLAIRVSQFLRDLSIKYDNSFIAIEDVRWVGNTMQNGRWNVGALFDWVSHQLFLVGGIAGYVSSYYNSQTCHKCSSTIKQGICSISHNDRVFYCSNCDDSWDRDINASANIAKRGIKRSEGLISYQLKNNFEKQSGIKKSKPNKHYYYSDKRFGGKTKNNKDRTKTGSTISRADARLRRKRINFSPPIIKKEVNTSFFNTIDPGQLTQKTNGYGRASNITCENNSVKVLLMKKAPLSKKTTKVTTLT